MMTPWRWLGLNLLLIAFMVAGLRVMEAGPGTQGSGIDTRQVVQTLHALNPDEQPHPTGSEANRRVREQIERRLSEMGYQPEVQARVYCTAKWPGCSAIENVIARKESGRPGADVILVTAHYDSVTGGPGAADNLAGVAAILEVAGLVRHEVFRNDVIFLFSDGEETGLRGAMTFAGDYPDMARVRLVLNLEARGAAGPSVMFETSQGNYRLIGLFSDGVRRPVANSLMYEIYRRLPNNTDMTIYKDAGAAGLNFAFYRHASLYHSSRDVSANLSVNSLVHHGDNVLSVLRRAGAGDLQSLTSVEDASYIDLFGRWLLHWPARLNLPASIICLLIIVVIGWRTGAIAPRPLLHAGGGVLALITGMVLAAWLLSWPLGRWPGLHPLDHPYPWPGRIALITMSLLAALIAGRGQYRRAGAAPAIWSSWMCLSLISILLAFALPGAAYTVLLPVLVFSLVACIEVLMLRRRLPVISAWAGLTACAYMAVYHFFFFEGLIFNYQASYLLMIVLVPAALAAAALVAQPEPVRTGPVATILGGAVLLAGAAGMVAPAFTAERPRPVNIAYMQEQLPDGERRSRWRVVTLAPADMSFLHGAGFDAAPASFDRFGIRPGTAHFRNASDAGLDPPRMDIRFDEVASGGRILKGTISRGRAGPFFGISFPGGAPVGAFLAEGVQLLGTDDFAGGSPRMVGFSGIRGEISFELHITGEAPLEAILFEISAFPEGREGQVLRDARPANAAPIHFSDHTEIQKRIRLQE